MRQLDPNDALDLAAMREVDALAPAAAPITPPARGSWRFALGTVMQYDHRTDRLRLPDGRWVSREHAEIGLNTA